MAVITSLTGVATAHDPTPDPGRTPTEARALYEAEINRATAYTLPPEKLKKAQTKAQIRHWLHFGGEAWSILQVLLLLGTGAVAWIQRTALRSRGGRWIQGLVFLALFVAALTLLDLPLSIAGQQVSRTYGLSVQGLGSWAGDQAKAFLLTCLIGWPIVMLLFSSFAARRGAGGCGSGRQPSPCCCSAPFLSP